MIRPTPLARDETSPYFHHNKRLAETWETLSQEFGGEIQGQFNGQVMEFTLAFCFKGKKVEIKGIRQVANVKAGLSNDFAMTKNTLISISPSTSQTLTWKVYKRNAFLDFYYRMIMNHQVLDYDKNYSFIASDAVPLNRILPQHLYTYISSFAELRSITKKEAVLSVEFFNLLSADVILYLIKKMMTI